MIKVFINDVEKTTSVKKDKFAIKQALTTQVDTCQFMFLDFQPTQGQTLKVWSGCELTSGTAAGSNVVLSLHYDFTYNTKYYIGDTVTVGIGTANEETATVTAVGTAQITVGSLANTHAVNDMVGYKFFGGTVDKVRMNEVPHNNSYILYDVYGVDWSKKFNRKLVNNAYADRTCAYIILDILNNYVNYNESVDDFEYDTVGELRAVWTESGDGDDPNRETTDFKEGDTAAEFPWTYSGGTATFSATPTSTDMSDITGVSSGAPTSGNLICWIKPADNTALSTIDFRIGSDSSNYTSVQYTVEGNDDWQYVELPLEDGSETGTPDWTVTDYAALVITETSSSNILIDGFRIVADDYFTMNNISSTTPIVDDTRFPRKSPSTSMERLANLVGYNWYIDYDQDIHFFASSDEGLESPFTLTDTSENYNRLSVVLDQSQIVNRITVQGGTEPSTTQTEIYEANGVQYVFYMGEQPRSIGYDNTLGRATYDFTLEIDTGGGYVSKTVGIINVDDAASFEWMLNPSEKYITKGTDSTPSNGDLLKFTYTYNRPIFTQQDNQDSIDAIKALVGDDGIREHTIINRNIKSTDQAVQYANSYLDKYANAVITLNFTTEYEGLKEGQVINFTNTDFGYSDESFLIQRVSQNIKANNEIWESKVLASTSVFGIIELMKLLVDEDLDIDEGETVTLIEAADETITASDAGSTAATNSNLTYTWATGSNDGDWNEFQWST